MILNHNTCFLVGGINLLPSYRVRSQFANYADHNEDSVSIDEWYSINQFDIDTKPDIKLGRFPVNNEDELKNIISKTISFEDSLVFKDFPIDFTFLTDKTDSTAFEQSVNNFINSSVPDNFLTQTIFAGQDSTISATRDNFFSDLSAGTLFFSYYGHGAPYKWSKYGLFTLNDIDSLKSNNLPFIYTAAACSQSFDPPDDSSIVRKLIVLPKSGTVASIASTGLNFLSQGSNFLTSFYNNIFHDPEITIGDALLKTKISSSDYAIKDGIYRRYTLLGDPALKIPVKIIAQVVDKPKDIRYSYSLKQNYPNPFNPSTTIRYSVPKESFVTITVYNILGQEISTLVNEEKNPGIYEIKFDGSKLSSGVYLYKMKADNFIEMKKFVLAK